MAGIRGCLVDLAPSRGKKSDSNSLAPLMALQSLVRDMKPRFDEALVELGSLRPRTSEEQALTTGSEKLIEAWTRQLDAALNFNELDEESILAFDEAGFAVERAAAELVELLR